MRVAAGGALRNADNLKVVHRRALLVNSGDIDAAVGCLADGVAGSSGGQAPSHSDKGPGAPIRLWGTQP
jgi:hypothetical protein